MQKTFDPIRGYVKPSDVFTQITDRTFQSLFLTLKKSQESELDSTGKCTPICILVDDMAGCSALHGGRISPFGNLAIQTPHWNITLIVITQQPTAVTPSFRDNIENCIMFPSEGELEVEWLKRSYNSLMISNCEKKRMEHLKAVTLLAWRGGHRHNKEWGKHFLGIHAPTRSHSRFYVDFKQEILLENEESVEEDEPPKKKRKLK